MCYGEECPSILIDRRSFIAGAAAAAAGFVAFAEGAAGQRQPPTRVLDDPRVITDRVKFRHNGQDTIDGFLSRPKGDGVYSAVLVVAGNKITEEYIPNTCAALAVAGFVGLAPNVFHPLPDTAPSNEYDRYLANHTELDRLDDIQAGASFLRTQPFVKPTGLGIIGFCRGGREAMLFAARSREVDAVVAFHPAPVTASEVARLRVPVQVHHGTGDHSVGVENTRALKATLAKQHTPVEAWFYDGADHGFLAYTRTFYRPEYARLAWSRSIAFLHKTLG